MHFSMKDLLYLCCVCTMCLQYMMHIQIPQGVSDEEAVRIFIEFSKVDTAIKGMFILLRMNLVPVSVRQHCAGWTCMDGLVRWYMSGGNHGNCPPTHPCSCNQFEWSVLWRKSGESRVL